MVHISVLSRHINSDRIYVYTENMLCTQLIANK